MAPGRSNDWEFRLRPNVRFHDGTPLTARDVVFSFARAKAELPVGFAGRIESIAEVRRIGEHTVQIVTKFPDPHSFLPKYNQEATKQVYEALLDIDFNLAIVPQLALAWKSLNPTTWEFKLRPHVTFHNGEPFTAADVVFSIERARAETSDFRGYVAGIVAVEAPDDRTVRFTTSAPDPSLWLKLAEVAILSKAWAERHDVTIPTDYNGAGEETYASRHANGPGPFMVEAFEPRGDYTLVRNPTWWGQADYPNNNVDRVVHVRKARCREACRVARRQDRSA